MNLKKRVSDLRSIVEGSGEGRSNAELWSQTLMVIDEMVNRIEQISHSQAKILDYVEALDEDLSVMESQINNPGNSEEDDEGYDLGSGVRSSVDQNSLDS